MRQDEYAEVPPSTFEIDALGRDDEALNVVVKGHLYVEQYLALLLSGAERHPYRLPFVAKIDRACQLGILQPDEGAMLKTFNRIRNRFAHEPRAYLSQDAVQELWATVSSRIKTRIAGIGRYGPEDFNVPLDCLKCCIVAICATLAEDLGADN